MHTYMHARLADCNSRERRLKCGQYEGEKKVYACASSCFRYLSDMVINLEEKLKERSIKFIGKHL